ncbi:MAG: hypothetical protein QM755_23885 [Luteolibacter sp.]
MSDCPLRYERDEPVKPDMSRVCAALGIKARKDKLRRHSTRDDRTGERSIWAGRPANYVPPRNCAPIEHSGTRGFTGRNSGFIRAAD